MNSFFYFLLLQCLLSIRFQRVDSFFHFGLFRKPRRLSQTIKYVPDLISYHGYPVEIHHVTTEDGYNIELHRIPFSKRNKTAIGGPPILLSQCFMCSSGQWIVLGAKRSLAFLLADDGYDVWMLNTRGNTYSTNHTQLSTRSRKFWDFSWHEMALYDVASSIDYILNLRNVSQLDYIGYSMGTTMFFVLMSEKPEYADKVGRMVAIAPAAYGSHTEGPIARTSSYIHFYERLAGDMDLREIPPREYNLNNILTNLCEPGNIFLMHFCSKVLQSFARASELNVDMSLLDLFFRFYPDTASLRTLTHYFQVRNSGNFQQFDFGEKRNYELYGSSEPPKYNLSRVVTPTAFFWAKSDPLSTYKDVARLRSDLPNVVLDEEIKVPMFSHGDFVWGKEAHKQVYKKVIEFLKAKL